MALVLAGALVFCLTKSGYGAEANPDFLAAVNENGCDFSKCTSPGCNLYGGDIHQLQEGDCWAFGPDDPDDPFSCAFDDVSNQAYVAHDLSGAATIESGGKVYSLYTCCLPGFDPPQCTESACTSPDGEGGPDCYAGTAEERMTCSGENGYKYPQTTGSFFEDWSHYVCCKSPGQAPQCSARECTSPDADYCWADTNGEPVVCSGENGYKYPQKTGYFSRTWLHYTCCKSPSHPPQCNTDYTIDYTSYQLAMALIPKFTGALSCIGSALIARHIVKKWRTSNREPLVMSSLIMFNLSIADFIGSFFGGFLSTWMIPNDLSHDYAFAAGNQATCNTQAFLYIMMLLVSNLSNMFLAIVYWLTVCREWPETKLRKIGWKLLLLGMPWIVGFVVSILPVAGDYDTEGAFWFCANEVMIVAFYMMVGTLPFILLCMGALIRFVHRSDQRMDEFRAEGQSRNRENTIRVTYQAIWYSLALFIVVLPFILLVLGVFEIFSTFAAVTLVPSQGLLNALVYFRPRYAADRERCRHRKQQLAQGQLHQSHIHINNSIFASICRVLDISLSSFPSFESISAILTRRFSTQTNSEQTGEETQQVTVQPQDDQPRGNDRELISHKPATDESAITVTKEEEHTTEETNVPDIDGAIHDETNLVFARNDAGILDDADTNPAVIGKEGSREENYFITGGYFGSR